MGNQFLLGSRSQSTEAEQREIVAALARERGLRHRLLRSTADPGDADDRLAPVRIRSLDLFNCQAQDWIEQAVPGLANSELGCVHADGQATGAGCNVVTEQGPLTAFIELPLWRERERTSG